MVDMSRPRGLPTKKKYFGGAAREQIMLSVSMEWAEQIDLILLAAVAIHQIQVEFRMCPLPKAVLQGVKDDGVRAFFLAGLNFLAQQQTIGVERSARERTQAFRHEDIRVVGKEGQIHRFACRSDNAFRFEISDQGFSHLLPAFGHRVTINGTKRLCGAYVSPEQ